MNDPDVYWVEHAEGRAPSIPWYYAYFQAADRCNCSPWDFIPEDTDRAFWMEAALIVNAAEGEHQQFLAKKSQSSSTTYQAARPGAIG